MRRIKMLEHSLKQERQVKLCKTPSFLNLALKNRNIFTPQSLLKEVLCKIPLKTLRYSFKIFGHFTTFVVISYYFGFSCWWFSSFRSKTLLLNFLEQRIIDSLITVRTLLLRMRKLKKSFLVFTVAF